MVGRGPERFCAGALLWRCIWRGGRCASLQAGAGSIAMMCVCASGWRSTGCVGRPSRAPLGSSTGRFARWTAGATGALGAPRGAGTFTLHLGFAVRAHRRARSRWGRRGPRKAGGRAGVLQVCITFLSARSAAKNRPSDGAARAQQLPALNAGSSKVRHGPPSIDLQGRGGSLCSSLRCRTSLLRSYPGP